MKISKGKRPNVGRRIVIHGFSGVGKTTLAASFPSALYLDIEGSTDTMDVARVEFGHKPTWNDVVRTLKDFASPECEFRTLVIDTIDWAERLLVEDICQKENKKSIEDFGYGKGYTHVEEEFAKFLNQIRNVCDETGKNVVLIAHTAIQKIELPDESSSFDKYVLKLSKKTTPLVMEWCELLLFVNFKLTVITNDDDKTKARGGKERVIHTSPSATHVAKNRHDLPAELAFKKEDPCAGLRHIFEKTVTSVEVVDKTKEVVQGNGLTINGVSNEDAIAFMVYRGYLKQGQSLDDLTDDKKDAIKRDESKVVAAINKYIGGLK